MKDFVFKNNKTPRTYSINDVEITFEMYKKKPKKIVGKVKEEIFSQLIKKNRIRENTLFYTSKHVFRLKSYDYSHWYLGEWLDREKFYIVVDLDRTKTLKIRKENEKNIEGE